MALAAGGAAAAGAGWSGIAPGRYVLAPGRSQVSFTVRKLLRPYLGAFGSVRGALTLEPQDLAASRVEIEIATASLEAPDPQIGKLLRGPAWFDAGRFPTLRFVSASLRGAGPGEVAIDGQITLHGVTRPMRFQARISPAAPEAGAAAPAVEVRAHGVLQRSQFGVTTDIPLVGDAVAIDFDARFQAPGAPARRDGG